VLGITNLSQVRAKTLQELVYKNGQAGITKASVSIIFDNEDKKQSPIGYENFNEIIVTRTVVIGGKNKYSINGAPVLANKISNLFMSVQLNVNNPHFLIMQGRIDGVVKMKPLELLSMLEEAAGTRMFEQKKQDAITLMQKKDKKIEEITNVLEQEIKPTLENLKKEKASYLKFTNLQREVETKTRFIAAHDYYQAKKRIASNDVADLEKKKKEVDKNQQLSLENIKDLTSQIKELTDKKRKRIGKRIQRFGKESRRTFKKTCQSSFKLGTFKRIAQSPSNKFEKIVEKFGRS